LMSVNEYTKSLEMISAFEPLFLKKLIELAGAPLVTANVGGLPELLTAMSATLVDAVVLVAVMKVSLAVYVEVNPVNLPVQVPYVLSTPEVALSASAPKEAATWAAVAFCVAVNVSPPTVTVWPVVTSEKVILALSVTALVLSLPVSG